MVNCHLLKKKTLQFYVLEHIFKNRLKPFTVSAVANNRHVSELFSLGRGVRPRDLLSPYLFIYA
jgi:hypothetical protein